LRSKAESNLWLTACGKMSGYSNDSSDLCATAKTTSPRVDDSQKRLHKPEFMQVVLQRSSSEQERVQAIDPEEHNESAKQNE
jgi:hypothetical protein